MAERVQSQPNTCFGPICVGDMLKAKLAHLYGADKPYFDKSVSCSNAVESCGRNVWAKHPAIFFPSTLTVTDGMGHSGSHTFLE